MLPKNQHFGAPAASAIWKFRRKASVEMICPCAVPAASALLILSLVRTIGSLCESAHAGILQDAQGTPIPQPCRFAANAAWLAVQVMAHNLDRWTARIGLGEPVVTTKTLRQRFFSITGRLTHSARRLTLHLPQRWLWENRFSRALARLRAFPFPT